MKWIICFSTVLLEVFFDRKFIISSLNNNENQLTILKGNSRRAVTEIPLHQIELTKSSPRENYLQLIKCIKKQTKLHS